MQADLKIIDFGLSRFEDDSEAMTTRVGTPYYIAPEGTISTKPTVNPVSIPVFACIIYEFRY